MPLHLRFGPGDLSRCRFAISPLCETHEAVRTLCRPQRHGYHVRWLRRARAVARGLDLSALSMFIPPHGYTPDFLGPPPEGPLGSARFSGEMARMRATGAGLAHREMALSLAFTPGAAGSAAGRAMLEDPGRGVRVLADVTEQAWRALVETDWPRLRSVLDADIAYRSRALAEGGLEALFNGLHPGVTWSSGTLTVPTADKVTRYQDLGGRGLILIPSVFAWPDVISGFAEPWQPALIYPARGVGGWWRPPPAPGAGALGRLLGGNRAGLLAGLGEPASTTTLAARHSLAPSTVSAHLSVLREAGLVTAHRRGHEVMYARTPLGAALARCSAPGGAP